MSNPIFEIKTLIQASEKGQKTIVMKKETPTSKGNAVTKFIKGVPNEKGVPVRVEYIGEVTAMVSPAPNVPPQGIPVQFKIDAESIKDAFEKFDAQAQVAMNTFLKEVKEHENKMKNKIVVPGQGEMANIDPSIFTKK